jgi:hypothetical protein
MHLIKLILIYCQISRTKTLLLLKNSQYFIIKYCTKLCCYCLTGYPLLTFILSHLLTLFWISLYQ